MRQDPNGLLSKSVNSHCVGLHSLHIAVAGAGLDCTQMAAAHSEEFCNVRDVAQQVQEAHVCKCT